MQEQKITQALKLLEQAQTLLKNQNNQNIRKSRSLLEDSITFLKKQPEEND